MRARLSNGALAPTIVVAAGVVAYFAGAGLSPYGLDLWITLLTYMVIAHGWNILGGYAGQVSLGVGAAVGMGGYTISLLLLHTGVPWQLGIPLGALTAVGLALVLAVPLLRLRGVYFAVGSLAAALALQAAVLNWEYAGGALGLTLPFEGLPDLLELFRVAVIACTLTLLVALYVRNSKFGMRLMAIRDDEGAATGVGVAATRHRLAAFVIASALWGTAGALVALQQTAISPNGILSISWALSAILMVVVGGEATFIGPTAGVFIVYYGLTKQFEGTEELALVVQGALLVAIVKFAPIGLWPSLVQLGKRLARGRMRSKGSASNPGAMGENGKGGQL